VIDIKTDKPRRVCRGCVMMKMEHYVCLFRTSMLEDKCPCIECLVKVICEESCEKRQEIYQALILKHGLQRILDREEYAKAN
jgi:hypothetical protein